MKLLPLPWTTGDRRTDAFVVWLLVATSILPVAAFVVDAVIDPQPLAGHIQSTAPGALGILLSLSRLCSGWGALLPLAVAVWALSRPHRLGTAIRLTAGFYVGLGLLQMSATLSYATANPASAINNIAGEVLRAALPLLLLLYQRDERGRLDGISAKIWAAGVTRLILLTYGALLAVGHFPLYLVGFMRMRAGAIAYRHPLLDMFPLLLLALCAVLWLTRGRLARSALWIALIAGAIRAGGAVVGVVTYARAVPNVAGRDQDLAGLVWDAVRAGDCLAIALVLAWYWWPVLAGRASARLDDEPRCECCGYNLTGNVSGRCPECGTAISNPAK